MKKLLFIFPLSSLIFLFGCYTQEPPQGETGITPPGGEPVVVERTTRAVCIGWNRVDPAAYGGWSGELSDCEFDALFAGEMWREFGFETSVLLTEDATKAHCKAALKESLNGLTAGDWLIVWTSGHGGQEQDASGDEVDGLDEYVCAYDGPVSDDTINEWLQAVPAGVCVLWICDTCHSGTMHKAAPTFGRDAIPRNFKGQLILISGCAEDGYSLSTGQGGVLSTALHDTGPVGMTPASWAAAVQARIPPETQQPQYVEYGDVTDDFRHGLMVPGTPAVVQPLPGVDPNTLVDQDMLEDIFAGFE